MKIKELFENTSQSITLLNQRVGDKIISKNTKDKIWNSSFICSGLDLTSLEFCPSIINGFFNCSDNDLTSLEHGPIKINGTFECSGNLNLKSFKGMPKEGIKNLHANNCDIRSFEFCPSVINGDVYCPYNENLTSLKGMPQMEVKDLIISNCNLTSLEGAPKKIDGQFDCSSNKNLTSLKGMPQEGVIDIDFSNCNISSLEGAPKKIYGNVYADSNPIISLKNVHKIIEEINGKIFLPESIESNILGLLKIKNLKSINFKNLIFEGNFELSKIINKYLPNPSPSQIIDCQNELIDAGFEEYAEL